VHPSQTKITSHGLSRDWINSVTAYHVRSISGPGLYTGITRLVRWLRSWALSVGAQAAQADAWFSALRGAIRATDSRARRSAHSRAAARSSPATGCGPIVR